MALDDALVYPRALLICVCFAACGDDVMDVPDAGVPSRRDGGTVVRDASVRDAGASPDAAVRDGGERDAGSRDAGSRDGGAPIDPPVLVEQAGGRTLAIEHVDGLAYVGVGPRLTIWDTTASPVRLGQTAPLGGLVESIAIHAGRAFVATYDTMDSHLHVIDTATVAQPVEIAVLRLGTGRYARLTDLWVDGPRLYAADFDQGVFVVDIADPDRPSELRMLAVTNVVEVLAENGRLYVVRQQFTGERAVEAYDAQTLEPLGAAGLGGSLTQLVRGGLVVVRNTQVTVEDISQLPTLRRLYTSPPTSVPMSAVDETGVWLSVEGRLRRLDLSDPEAIVASPAYGQDIWALTAGAASGGRLAVIDHQGGLEVFDTTAGATSLGEVWTGPCAYCFAAATSERGIVVTETTPGAAGSVTLVRSEDLAWGARRHELTVDFEHVVVEGDVAYVADWFTGLRAYDVSEVPPRLVATAETSGAPTAVAVAGPYVVLGEGSGGGALRVFDPGAGRPTELGSIATAFVDDLAAQGTIVYAATRTLGAPGGLYIYDLATPADIRELAHYAGECEAALGVAVEGPRAVVACEDGVHVLDVSDPSAPKRLSRYVPDQSRKGGPIALSNAVFYVALEDGVSVVDIAQPASPSLLGVHPTAWLPRNVTVGRGRVVAAGDPGGVYQWAVAR